MEVDPSQASGIVVSILLVILTSFCATSAEERYRIRLLVLGSASKQADEERGRRAQGVGRLPMRLLEEVSQEEMGKMGKLRNSRWRGIRGFVTMPAHHRGDRKTRMFDDEARWGTELRV